MNVPLADSSVFLVVGDRENPRPDRDLISLQSLRVPRTVELLVMGFDNLPCTGQKRDSLQQRSAEFGMATDVVPLLLGQSAFLEEERKGDTKDQAAPPRHISLISMYK